MCRNLNNLVGAGGPFTFRLPFYHSKLCWPEFFQGLLIAAAQQACRWFR